MAQEQKFYITATYLGPIFSLNGKLSEHGQNLVFARNGTGKSFLSRAFYYLDLYSQGEALKGVAKDLVSDEADEATDGKGCFAFLRGETVMGKIHLEKSEDAAGDVADAEVPVATIFHVFSEDFIEKELKEYNLDGKIENKIIVGRTNIQLEEARSALEKTNLKVDTKLENLQEKFNSEKKTKLTGEAEVDMRLKEYGTVTFERLLNICFGDAIFADPRLNPPDPTFEKITADIKKIKAIPSRRTTLEEVALVETPINSQGISDSLRRVTLPASVKDNIRERIIKDPDFYKTGVLMIDRQHRNTCPFCEQDITLPGPKNLIYDYKRYFNDDEERHRRELQICHTHLEDAENRVDRAKNQMTAQELHYNNLKQYIPSKQATSLDDIKGAIEKANSAITSVKNMIRIKSNELSTPFASPERDLSSYLEAINRIIERNNKKISELFTAIIRSDYERKNLQRKACFIFEREFLLRHWGEIEDLGNLKSEAKVKKSILTNLEETVFSEDGRDRVVKTFKRLLRRFFYKKYDLNEENFTLKRDNREMARGPLRTLSSGERSVIAFCYFIACIHKKVADEGDYEKLFLVFDDPVTSMSYDYLHTIAQTLRDLKISEKGEISLELKKNSKDNFKRPELLILTHSTYFFNVSRTNKVVGGDACFVLYPNDDIHEIECVRKYMPPFQDQLRAILQISNNQRAPDHATANSVRSVLEAIGRFCEPDKASDFINFVQHLRDKHKIHIKSLLINSLCHGAYDEEQVLPVDDLRLACKETIKVTKKYAPGQLEML